MAREIKPNSAFENGDGASLGLSYDYRIFFTDKVCSSYLKKFEAEKKSPGKNDLYMRAAAAVYATAIYYIYPNQPLFRKGIDSDKELSANFWKMKQWVDANGYERLADEIVSNVAKAMGLEKVN